MLWLHAIEGDGLGQGVVIESRDLPKIFDLCDKDHHGEIDDRAIFGCRTSDRWLRVGMIR